jgi:hypothetical protein
MTDEFGAENGDIAMIFSGMEKGALPFSFRALCHSEDACDS